MAQASRELPRIAPASRPTSLTAPSVPPSGHDIAPATQCALMSAGTAALRCLRRARADVLPQVPVARAAAVGVRPAARRAGRAEPRGRPGARAPGGRACERVRAERQHHVPPHGRPRRVPCRPAIPAAHGGRHRRAAGRAGRVGVGAGGQGRPARQPLAHGRAHGLAHVLPGRVARRGGACGCFPGLVEAPRWRGRPWSRSCLSGGK